MSRIIGREDEAPEYYEDDDEQSLDGLEPYEDDSYEPDMDDYEWQQEQSRWEEERFGDA